MNLKELFKPNTNKIILFAIIAIFFLFFPIITRSVFAVPFLNIDSVILSIVLNLLIAYVFSSLIFSNLKDKKKLILVIVIIAIIYLGIPKIAKYEVGDLGGTTETYCSCYGATPHLSSCCNSSVNYCVGICQRNEKTESWVPYLR